MPAILLIAPAFALGIAAGLLWPFLAWTLSPLLAVGAFFVGGRRLAAGVSLAAGILWGAATRYARDADCRVRWRDGQRVAVTAEPMDLAAPDAEGPAVRYAVRAPAACGGAVSIRLPQGAPRDTPLVLVGTWRRDPLFRDGLLTADWCWDQQL